jgi:hypothetical protein
VVSLKWKNYRSVIGMPSKSRNTQIKDVLRLALLENPTRIRSNLPLNLGNLLPFSLEREFTPFLNKTDDEISLSRRGVELDAEQIAILSKAVHENFPKYAPLVAGLGGKVVLITILLSFHQHY